MIRDAHSLILEPRDQLFRYDFGIDLPDQWQVRSSPEYQYPELGAKNQFGGFFFYDNEEAAKRVLEVACRNRYRNTGKRIEYATITSCQLQSNARLFDMDLNIPIEDYSCTSILSYLVDADVNVLTDSFYNYQRNENYTVLRDRILQNGGIANSYGDIEDFFLSHPMFMLQHLSDFGNGISFKDALLEKGYEGFRFVEDTVSDTYCLFTSEKITCPHHDYYNIITLFPGIYD